MVNARCSCESQCHRAASRDSSGNQMVFSALVTLIISGRPSIPLSRWAMSRTIASASRVGLSTGASASAALSIHWHPRSLNQRSIRLHQNGREVSRSSTRGRTVGQGLAVRVAVGLSARPAEHHVRHRLQTASSRQLARDRCSAVEILHKYCRCVSRWRSPAGTTAEEEGPAGTPVNTPPCRGSATTTTTPAAPPPSAAACHRASEG